MININIEKTETLRSSYYCSPVFIADTDYVKFEILPKSE